MKIILLILTLSIFCFSCRENKTINHDKMTDLDETSKKDNIKTENNTHLQNYIKYLATLKEKDITSIPKAISYFDSGFNEIDSKIFDELFAEFNNFYEKVMNYQQNQFTEFEYTEQLKIYEAMFDITYQEQDWTPPNDNQKNYANFLKENGLNLCNIEGNLYVCIDYPYIFNKIKDKISLPTEQYLIQTQSESEELYTSDTGIIVPIETIANRIIFWEDFIKDNDNFIYINEATKLFTEYKKAFFKGFENTPAFNIETKTLNQEFKEGYNFIIENYSETEIGKLTKEYFDILEKNNFIESEESINFLAKKIK